jgi:hypothetical protein
MAETRSRRVFSTSISASGLTSLLGNGRAGAIVLLLDCCYSGAMSKEFHRGSATEELGALAREVSGLHVITATTGTQTAREREEESDGHYMGAFTRQLVEGLRSGAADRDGDGIVTLSDLERHLRETVRQQTPRRTSHDASGDPVIARALPQATADERRLERLGHWHNEGRLTVDAYNDLVGVLDGQDGEATKLLIERLLDDPKTGPRALLGVLRASRQPEQSPPVRIPLRERAQPGKGPEAPSAPPEEARTVGPPPVRIPLREQTEARNTVEEPGAAPEAAPIVVPPFAGRSLLERIPPFITGQVAGAVIAGSMIPVLGGAGAGFSGVTFMDWLILSMAPLFSVLVCWRWPGPGAPAWQLLPVGVLATPTIWLPIATAMGLAHLPERSITVILFSSVVPVLAGLAWRLFKEDEAGRHL